MTRVTRLAKGVAQNTGQFLTSLASRGVKGLGLVPVYLSHLLWLIEAKFRELTSQGYGGNGAVYACLRFLSTSVPEPPLIAYTRKPEDGEPDGPLPWAHPLAKLLRNPNSCQTQFEAVELLTLHLAIVGCSRWWKERDNLTRVTSLWPLRPDRVGIVYGNAAEGEPPILGYSYLVPGTTQYLGIPARDIINFNFPDPMGESGGLAEGFGPLMALASEISADNAATQFVGAMVTNYAQPGVIISAKRQFTSEDDAKLIKFGFQRDFGGMRRGDPLVIDNDSTVTPVGFSLSELEFPSLRNQSESRIAAAIGVPAILVGLNVGLTAGIKATIDELRAEFAQRTLPSYWGRIEERISIDLAEMEFGEGIVCRFDTTKVAALASVSAVRIAQIAQGFEDGAVTKNEYRDALGLEPRDDGDEYVSGISHGTGAWAPIPAAGTQPAPFDPNNPHVSTVPAPQNQPAMPQSGGPGTDGSNPVSNGHSAAGRSAVLEQAKLAVADGEHDIKDAIAKIVEQAFGGK